MVNGIRFNTVNVLITVDKYMCPFTYTYTDDGFVAVIFFAFAVALILLSLTNHTIVLTFALRIIMLDRSECWATGPASSDCVVELVKYYQNLWHPVISLQFGRQHASRVKSFPRTPS